jgi:hypothetical protein
MIDVATLPGPDADSGNWEEYVNVDCYTAAEQRQLADALFAVYVEEFNARLPRSWYWAPAAGQVLHPDHPIPVKDINFDELLDDATAATISRFQEIEKATIGAEIHQARHGGMDDECPICNTEDWGIHWRWTQERLFRAEETP